MSDNKKIFAPAIFGLTVICFLLPFVSVSCGNQKVVTLTGFDLATGTTVQQPGMFGAKQKQKVSAEPTATLALIAALLGLSLSFVSGKIPALVRAVIGGFAALMLLLLKGSLDDQVTKRASGMVSADFEFGFWFALLLMIGGAAFNGYLAAEKEIDGSGITNVPTVSTLTGERASLPESAPAPACPHCGAPTEVASKFCGACGQRLSAKVAAGQSRA